MQIHFFELLSVKATRRTHDGSHLEIAVTEHVLRWLIENEFPVKRPITSRDDVSLPTMEEETDYGPWFARRWARKTFINDAINAILSGKHGRGLERYYMEYTNDEVKAGISWGILLGDILVRLQKLNSLR